MPGSFRSVAVGALLLVDVARLGVFHFASRDKLEVTWDNEVATMPVLDWQLLEGISEKCFGLWEQFYPFAYVPYSSSSSSA